VRHLRDLGASVAIVAVTWLLLGWPLARAIGQADASVTWIPYAHSALGAGSWTEHLYRFGVLGGSAMHDAGGTPPLLSLCALLHLPPTLAANAMTIALQALFGFFGCVLCEALVSVWTSGARTLTWPERITLIWACAFVPALGWRVAYGHDNLLLGLLPYAALVALWWAGRAGTLSITALCAGALATAEGVSGLGPQTLVYSAVFGAPFVIAGIAGTRWGRAQAAVGVALVAGVLLVLPRAASMFHYQLGDDAGRGVGHALVYSYGGAHWTDWLGGVPWTLAAAPTGALPSYETNFPIGPFAALLVLAWPSSAQRRVPVALALGAVLAVLFSLDVRPVSSALLALPMTGAFRVPARAILPVLLVLAPLALAALFTRERAADKRLAWGAIAAGALVIVSARVIPAVVREPLAWAACLALGALARWRPGRAVAAISIVAALGVAAFDERVPHEAPSGRIEDTAALRTALLAQEPALVNPLVRVQIVDAPMPFEMSTAFAAGVSSLDGAWFPPRRFLHLLSVTSGEEVPPTTGVFTLTRAREFPVLQQMYNVRYVLSIKRQTIDELPPTPGPAWFPAHVHSGEPHLTPQNIATDAWVEMPGIPDACSHATVTRADAADQTATLAGTADAPCLLVVATNYVHALHARAAGRELPVVPVDIALTGIVVPAGSFEIVLAPEPYRPWWTLVGALVGLVALSGAIAAMTRAR
jgi:hypothetical protein